MVSVPLSFFRNVRLPAFVLLLLAGLFCGPAAPAAWGGSLTGLGMLGSDGPFFLQSAAARVSPDGSAVVGVSSSASGPQAFLWTQAGGMVGLGDLPGGGFYSQAADLSADGSVVVGMSVAAAGLEAFRWTQAGGMVGLGSLPGGAATSYASAITPDGSVIVGGAGSANGDEAFRWTQAGGMVGLGDLPGGMFSSSASAITPDGSVIVGRAGSANGDEAFRWTQAGGMVGLGDLPGGMFGSAATEVSADGSVVVGMSESANGEEAFRWTQAGGMVGLGDLPGGLFSSHAFGITADGSVIVGRGASASGEEAFRWTQGGGMVAVKDWLEDSGVDTTGWRLKTASAVSDDGETIVGIGERSGNEEAFIARPGGLVTPGALNQSLGDMTGVGPAVSGLGMASMGVLGGAASPGGGGVAGLASGEGYAGRLDFWVSGAMSANSELDGDDFGLRGGLGLTWELGNDWRVGGGVFANSRDLETAHGGSQEIGTLGPGAFVGWAPAGTGLDFSLSALWQGADLRLERGYMNGAGSVSSTGTTEAELFGVMARAQWTRSLTGSLALMPFAEYAWQTVHLRGYTEGDGPFPARYDSRDEDSNTVRLGLQLGWTLSERVTAWTWGALNHRFEGSSGAMSGTMLGLGRFDFEGSRTDQDWADVGLGASWRLTERLSVSSRLGVVLGCDDDSLPDMTATVGLTWRIW